MVKILCILKMAPMGKSYMSPKHSNSESLTLKITDYNILIWMELDYLSSFVDVNMSN